MARMARQALVNQGGSRVLMLGLGGGTIAGQLLLSGCAADGGFDPHLSVTSIETDLENHVGRTHQPRTEGNVSHLEAPLSSQLRSC